MLTPLFAAGMFLVVLANNLGVMWFAVEATALVLRAAGGALQPPDFARSRLEIHHPRQPGPGAGAVRHGVPLRGGRRPARLRDAAQLQLVAPDDRGAAVRSRPHQTGLRLRAHRLRHQGRPGADAHLAARRAQRGALAHQRDALRRVAQNRALRLAAISHSHHGLPGHRLQRASSAGLRTVLHVSGRAVHSGAEESQTDARLFEPGTHRA